MTESGPAAWVMVRWKVRCQVENWPGWQLRQVCDETYSVPVACRGSRWSLKTLRRCEDTPSVNSAASSTDGRLSGFQFTQPISKLSRQRVVGNTTEPDLIGDYHDRSLTSGERF